jgi:hypothetical protein
MKKTSPVEMRKALTLVEAFKKAGILFVPVPVMSENDLVALTDQVSLRLDIIEKGEQ